MPTDRSLSVPYVPGPPPAVGANTNAIWDEFYRLQAALFDLDRPAAIVAVTSEIVTVDPATVWTLSLIHI